MAFPSVGGCAVALICEITRQAEIKKKQSAALGFIFCYRIIIYAFGQIKFFFRINVGVNIRVAAHIAHGVLLSRDNSADEHLPFYHAAALNYIEYSVAHLAVGDDSVSRRHDIARLLVGVHGRLFCLFAHLYYCLSAREIYAHPAELIDLEKRVALDFAHVHSGAEAALAQSVFRENAEQPRPAYIFAAVDFDRPHKAGEENYKRHACRRADKQPLSVPVFCRDKRQPALFCHAQPNACFSGGGTDFSVVGSRHTSAQTSFNRARVP